MSTTHERIAPLSALPTMPVATTQPKGGAKRPVSIREAQVCNGQLDRERVLRDDDLSPWEAPGYWNDMDHLFGHDDTPIPQPPVGTRDHDFPRGLSVSGYAVVAGLIVQEMVLIVSRGARREIMRRRYTYGPGVTMECVTEARIECSSNGMARHFLEQLAHAHDWLHTKSDDPCFDTAIVQARALNEAQIERRWQDSRASTAAARAENFAPGAPLAF
ncbi:hypothetical protein J7355_15670 [Endozoicomonas sp. G2_2]|uniref:hypothetical protein n=1 Tax=Endozoicomonas sp. G2_2 TaxID=2821092 RepID=UPI001ADD18D2|nr:hypothetical protein [Endozoicomonas sp. G2_2]MBO9471528.1 hypothetical protein [Endozoicomonas sp. G2_2]